MYQQGTAKEMKKWAYEIHSSFLVPGAVSISPIISSLNIYSRLKCLNEPNDFLIIIMICNFLL